MVPEMDCAVNFTVAVSHPSCFSSLLVPFGERLNCQHSLTITEVAVFQLVTGEIVKNTAF